MRRILLVLITLMLAVLACNWSDIVPPAAPEIEPSPLPTFAINTLTAVPTQTPLPTPTFTPDAPMAWPKDLAVNCRFGPGEEWEAISSITVDATTTIKGRTVNTAWWYVVDPLHEGDFCWVAYDVMDTAGNLDIVPIIEAPASAVTAVTVDANVTFIGCGSDNPVTFSGQIKTNGPATVTFYWEVTGDTKFVIPDNTVKMTGAGTKTVTVDLFSADCGAYTVKLWVENPNSISAEKVFAIQAP